MAPHRVVRPGGAVAFEGDFMQDSTCEPPCAAVGTLRRVWRDLFPNPGATTPRRVQVIATR